MQITGKITQLLEFTEGTSSSGKEWKKQLFLVDTETQFNNLYCFEVFGVEKVDNFLDHFVVGDNVKVDFNVNTSEYQGKYFTTLQAWKTEKQ